MSASLIHSWLQLLAKSWRILFSLKEILKNIYVMFFKVLVHGSAEATEHLKQHFSKFVPNVYAPQVEDTIDVTSDLCAYKVGSS